jgi:glycosyltransferase involved in cell wall biosynthesis
MHVLFDTTPLQTGHAHRGIGLYTALLSEELQKNPEIELSFTLKEAKAKHKAIDIVHYPYFDLFFHTLPVFKPGKKSVVTIHDVIPLQFKQYYPVGKKGTVAFISQKIALSGVDLVLTDSVSSQKSIRSKLSISEKKSAVIYLAGNPAISHQTSEIVGTIKAKYHLPDEYILYVGDINYNKNIPQLIKTLKFLDDRIHLVLFGKNFFPHDIPEWQWIETQIALSDVESRVHFLPALDGPVDTELSAVYSGAEIYVQPSLAEGFGLPVLEALQCKVPVVSSNTTSLPEIGGSCVTYADPTAESLALAIESVLNLNTVEKTKLIEKGYAWAKTFSWKKTAQETFEAYTSLL